MAGTQDLEHWNPVHSLRAPKNIHMLRSRRAMHALYHHETSAQKSDFITMRLLSKVPVAKSLGSGVRPTCAQMWLYRLLPL